MNKKNHLTEAYFLGMLSIMAFATTLPLAKNLVGDLSGVQIGIYRSLFSALAALPIVLLAKLKWPTRSQVKRLFITSIGTVYAFPILTAVGMQYVPISHGGVVLAALPLCASIFSVMITKQKPPFKFWVLAFTGFFIVCSYVFYDSGDLDFYLGDVALMMAALFAGLGYAQGGALSKEMPGWKVTCWILILNLPILIIISFFIFDKRNLELTPLGWFSILFMGLVNSFFAFFIWYRALALGGVAKITQVQLLQVFITYGYAVFFFNEAWDWVTVIAFSLIVFVLYLNKKI